MKRNVLFCILFLAVVCTWAQTAQLVPAAPFYDRQVKKGALEMDGMDIDVRFNGHFARVQITQVYYNNSPEIFEGQYKIFIRSNGLFDDFAIWENGERIPGVILEKKRARSLYEEIKYLQIDPGLAARPEGEEAHQTGTISIKVAPIQPYAYKRIEFSYIDLPPLLDFSQYFTLYIAPESGPGQKVRRLNISLSGRSGMELEKVREESLLNMDAAVKDNGFAMEKSLADVLLDKNIRLRWNLKRREKLFFQFYRQDEPRNDYYAVSPELQTIRDSDGYFLITAVLKGETAGLAAADYHFVLDLSTSITPENLQLEIEALSALLKLLPKGSRYRVYGFNQDIFPVDEGWQQPQADAIQSTFTRIYALKLASGSNLSRVLDHFTLAGERPVIFSDGFPTLGEMRFAELGKLKPAASFFIVGLGKSQNSQLLAKLAEISSGYYQPLEEGAGLQGKLEIFASFLASRFFSGLRFLFSSPDVSAVYPEKFSGVFPGNGIRVSGKYSRPGAKELQLRYRSHGKDMVKKERVDFPEKESRDPGVAKIWAGQRIQFLLEQVSASGEKPEWIEEIIRLSKRFKIITPYTSMLAAHRSYLLPEAMRPADPLLIVKAHPDIVAVEAELPFGETKKLVYNPGADHWRTRFIVPANTADGEYGCQVILRDRQGHVYLEKKKFRVDASAPVFRSVGLEQRVVSPGDVLRFEVRAPRDTRRITAFNPLLGKTELKYDPQSASSRGHLRIAPGVPPGAYDFVVEAVDFAQNQFSRTVTVEVSQ
jgi:Ca-activated chloride channel family protein